MFKLPLYILLGIIVSLIQHTRASAVWSTKPCKVDDKKCLAASAQEALALFIKGIPEYGIPPFDPVYVESGKFEHPNLYITYKDVYIHGLKDCKILDIEHNVAANTATLEIETPARIVGQYELKGRMLFMDLIGKGDINIEAEKIHAKLNAKLKSVTGSDGLNHLKITSFDYTYVMEKKVNIKLSNLTGNDKNTGNAIQEFIDAHQEQIIDQIGKPIITSELTNVVGYINKFFENVPTEQFEIV